MKPMPENVVAFRSPEHPSCWCQNELQQLMSMYSAYASVAATVSWSVGQTEAADPQFYLLADTHDLDCVLCVTRIGRLYVLEDGAGTVVAEDTRLDRIAAEASKMLLPKRRRTSFLASSLVGVCAFRNILDQKIELMLAESLEHVSRFAPQLVAFV